MANLNEAVLASLIAEDVTQSLGGMLKEVLTVEEASRYMGMSKSSLYKLTMNGTIPCYKPTGKMVYFNRKELEQWLQSNRVATRQELNDKAYAIMRKGSAK